MRPNVKTGARTRRLRGADPLTVEVELSGLVNRPLSQVSAGTLVDLIALTEKEALSPAVAVRLRGYVGRVAREVADIPSGAPLLGWVEALEEVEPSEVPASLRTIFVEESARRGGVDQERLVSLCERWAEVDPAPFVYGEPRVQARQLTEGRRRKEPVKSRQARPSEAPEGKVRPGRRPKAPTAPKPGTDPAQTAWVRQLVLERLAASSSQGLLEPVLLAAVRHRSRDRFPDLLENDVRDVLRQMAGRGEVHLSSRRWSLKR